MKTPEPVVVISKCIEFDNVRYDGQIISSSFVKQILPFIKAIPVCPEVEIGLGVPRHTLRLVKKEESTRLVQPSTEKDLTDKMNDFAEKFLDSIEDVDGFILKGRSPSSAMKDANIYADIKNAPRIGRGPGIFGGAVLERFSHLAVEDEGRLRNGRIREHFLRKLFTLARFRNVKEKGEVKDLIGFHTNNKLLLKAYNQEELRKMGRIVANQDKYPLEKVFNEYEGHLYSSLEKGPACTPYINVLMELYGVFLK